jgi:hypothetical protein
LILALFTEPEVSLPLYAALRTNLIFHQFYEQSKEVTLTTCVRVYNVIFFVIIKAKIASIEVTFFAFPEVERKTKTTAIMANGFLIRFRRKFQMFLAKITIKSKFSIRISLLKAFFCKMLKYFIRVL